MEKDHYNCAFVELNKIRLGSTAVIYCWWTEFKRFFSQPYIGFCFLLVGEICVIVSKTASNMSVNFDHWLAMVGKVTSFVNG